MNSDIPLLMEVFGLKLIHFSILLSIAAVQETSQVASFIEKSFASIRFFSISLMNSIKGVGCEFPILKILQGAHFKV